MGPRNRAIAVSIVLIAAFVCIASARTGPAAVLATASDKYIIETKEALASTAAAANPEAADATETSESVTIDELDEDTSEAETEIGTAASSVAKHGKSASSSNKKKHQKTIDVKQYGTPVPEDEHSHDDSSDSSSDSSSSDGDAETSTDNSSESDSSSDSKSAKKAAKKHKNHDSKAQKYPSFPVRQEEDHTTGKKGHGHHKNKAAKTPKVRNEHPV